MFQKRITINVWRLNFVRSCFQSFIFEIATCLNIGQINKEVNVWQTTRQTGKQNQLQNTQDYFLLCLLYLTRQQNLVLLGSPVHSVSLCHLFTRQLWSPCHSFENIGWCQPDWATTFPDLWPHIILSVSLRLILDDINLWICKHSEKTVLPDVGGRHYLINWIPE